MRLLLLLNNILKNIATMLMRSNNCTYIIISSNDVYYTMLHIRYTTYITNCALNSMYCIDILDNMYLCVYMFNSNLYDNICIVAVLDNTTQSITTLFPSNNWYERECSEFFGVSFENSCDTRNLLLPYIVKTHPLQKSWIDGCYTVIGSRFNNEGELY